MNTNELIIADLAEAWRTLNSDLIIKHLSKDFRYDSQWVFESLDYEGYKNYIARKFATLAASRSAISVKIVDDPYYGGKMLLLDQSGNVSFYRIRIDNGLVVKGDLCMF